jgi:hypothetical protein
VVGVAVGRLTHVAVCGDDARRDHGCSSTFGLLTHRSP